MDHYLTFTVSIIIEIHNYCININNNHVLAHRSHNWLNHSQNKRTIDTKDTINALIYSSNARQEGCEH